MAPPPTQPPSAPPPIQLHVTTTTCHDRKEACSRARLQLGASPTPPPRVIGVNSLLSDHRLLWTSYFTVKMCVCVCVREARLSAVFCRALGPLHCACTLPHVFCFFLCYSFPHRVAPWVWDRSAEKFWPRLGTELFPAGNRFDISLSVPYMRLTHPAFVA